ncbi:MAG: hypothetical protein V2A71_10370 [Candidatus Eisenbacteria bacterium]
MPPRGQGGHQQIVKERNPYDPRHPWRERVRLFAGVTPQGFWIEGHVYPELRGRVISTCFVRKLFVDRCLVCYAPDAICAREGYHGEGCSETKCRPYLRIELAYDVANYSLDLGISSVVNFVRMEELALASGQLIGDVPLRLTVANHGEGDEVRFECV